MTEQNRCTSGLHFSPVGKICSECKAIRRAIWSAKDPIKAQHEYNTLNAKALEQANAFCKARDAKQQAIAIEEQDNYWRAFAVKGLHRRKTHSSLLRSFSMNSRAKRLKIHSEVSPGLLDKLMKLQKGKCVCCRRPLGEDFHMDHIQPLSKGGSNHDTNIQLLRKECNLKKQAKDPIDFMQEKGFLL